MSRSPVVSAFVLLVAAILAVALFVAGAMWRGTVTRGQNSCLRFSREVEQRGSSCSPPASRRAEGVCPAKAVFREYNVLSCNRPSEQEDGHEDPGVIRYRDNVITGRRKR